MLSKDMIGALESYYSKALTELEFVKTTADVERIRVSYLGKKGLISEILAKLKDLTPDQKKEVGQVGTRVRGDLETKLVSLQSKLGEAELDQKLVRDSFDTTMPGVFFASGSQHPIKKVLNECIEILRRAGLVDVYGPEVELEDYCFDRLNFKPGHAARDMQATFFVKDSDVPVVMRTHTSPVQVRVLLEAAQNNFALPIRIQAPGRVYRVDDDRTHSPMFHQIEGLGVDQWSSMGDLRAVLDFFFRQFFDQGVKVRFRPSYFPFTEPSVEVDVSCVFCRGQGCKVCKQSGWLEVAGAGMVHPEVFSLCGWDPSKVQGWAFGMGIERLAMLKLGISDLRLFFENRLSFLRGGSL